MKVIIEGTAKEIAALVLELQERQHVLAKLSTTESGNELTDGGFVIVKCADDILKSK